MKPGLTFSPHTFTSEIWIVRWDFRSRVSDDRLQDVFNQIKDVMTYIGIDISKDSFVAAFPKVSGCQTQTYPNTVKGIRKFIGSLSVTEHHCVMEATGNYGFLLLYLLDRQGIAASMVNPKQIKHFSRMMMTVTKTDAKDGINRNGDASLRPLLYVASWSALRGNTTCKECYVRLKANGKPSKVALIAIANELVRQAFAVIKSDAPYVNGFVSTHQTK